MNWAPQSNCETLRYKHVPISLASIQECQGTLEDYTVSLLENFLLGIPCDLDFACLVDGVDNTAQGYSFLTDKGNSSIFGNPKRLYAHIHTTDALWEKFILATDPELV